MKTPRFKIDLEYEALRDELVQGKKYIFGRPVFIVSGGVALLQVAEKDYAVYLPILIMGLLLFNLWFTVNRLISMARIVAYLQLILENKDVKWIGWESSLRYYRKYLKKTGKNSSTIRIKDIDKYDNIGFYPPIYFLHLILTFGIYITIIVITLLNKNAPAFISSSICTIIFILFSIYSVLNRPSKILPQIENNRKIWKIVMQEWDN